MYSNNKFVNVTDICSPGEKVCQIKLKYTFPRVTYLSCEKFCNLSITSGSRINCHPLTFFLFGLLGYKPTFVSDNIRLILSEIKKRETKANYII